MLRWKWVRNGSFFYDAYDNNDAAFAAVADNRLSLVNMDGTDNPEYTNSIATTTLNQTD